MKNPWLLAIRPKTLFASVSPVILALAMVIFNGHVPHFFFFALTFFCALFLQISTNLINDYYDFKKGVDGVERIGPQRVTQSGLLEAKNVKQGFVFTMILSFSLGLILMSHGGWPIVLIGLSSLFFAWAYTGGPYPLAYFALGEILALLFFGPVAVWGAYFIQTRSFDLFPALVGLGPGLISAAIMGINNLRDRSTDWKNGKHTLATLSTEKGARCVVLGAVVASFLPPMALAWYLSQPSFFLVPLTALPFYSIWRRIATAPIDAGLNIALAKTGQYLLCYCLSLSLLFFFLRS